MEIVNSLLLLQPGIYFLRHPKNNVAPLTIARAAASPGATGSLQVMGTPGTDNSVLRTGADCLIVQVLGNTVELLVTAYLPHAGATVPALRVDQVGLDPAPGSMAAATSAPAPAGAPALAIASTELFPPKKTAGAARKAASPASRAGKKS